MPLTLFCFCIGVMCLLHLLLPVDMVVYAPLNLVGIVPILLGLGLIVSVNRLFIKIGNEVGVFKKPHKLITSRWFELSRNPIYLGFAMALFGIWFLLGSMSTVFLPIIFILVIDVWYIRHEEKVLEDTFGKDFINYKKKVGRWL